MNKLVDLEIVRKSIRNIPDFSKPEIHFKLIFSRGIDKINESVPVWSLIHF
jgi:hypothetical protein